MISLISRSTRCSFGVFAVFSCTPQQLDQPEPILQIGNQFFQGSLQPTLGTTLCFEELKPDQGRSARLQRKETSTTLGSSTLNGNHKLTFALKSDKTLLMKRVFLQPKGSSVEQAQSESEPDLVQDH